MTINVNKEKEMDSKEWEDDFIKACEEWSEKEVRSLYQRSPPDERAVDRAIFNGFLMIYGKKKEERQEGLEVLKFLLTDPQVKESILFSAKSGLRGVSEGERKERWVRAGGEGFRYACRVGNKTIIEYLLGDPKVQAKGHHWMRSKECLDRGFSAACAAGQLENSSMVGGARSKNGGTIIKSG